MKERERNVKIKICGLCREEDADYANEVSPDYVGLVFWEKSKRYATAEVAQRIRDKIHSGIQVVGVFLDAPVEEVIALLQQNVIDMAQLHGSETEEDIQYIQAVTGKPVMKAVKVQHRYDVEAWLDSSADYLLFDAGTGSGQTFDWELLADVEREFFLAGGLTADNIPEAIQRVGPYAVDLSSGVETDGKKDLDKMRKAVLATRRNKNE